MEKRWKTRPLDFQLEARYSEVVDNDEVVLRTVLPGHTSPQTAYEVQAQFGCLRNSNCKIRYWLEYDESLRKFRFWVQRTHPNSDEWATAMPRGKGAPLAVMGLDKDGKVNVARLMHPDLASIRRFGKLYGDYFDEQQRRAWEAYRDAALRLKARNNVGILKASA